MSDVNRRVIERLFDEIWNQHRLDIVNELFSSDHVLKVGRDAIRGQSGMRKVVSLWQEGFPEMKFSLDDVIVSGDQVVVRWTGRGVQMGTFMGIPPTQKEVSYWGISLYLIRDGKIMATWGTSNLTDLLDDLNERVPPPSFGIAS